MEKTFRRFSELLARLEDAGYSVNEVVAFQINNTNGGKNARLKLKVTAQGLELVETRIYVKSPVLDALLTAFACDVPHVRPKASRRRNSPAAVASWTGVLSD